MKIAVFSTVGGYSWAGSEELWFGLVEQGLKAGHTFAIQLHRDLRPAKQVENLRRSGVPIYFHGSRLHPRLQRLRSRFSRPLQHLVEIGPDLLLVSMGSPLDAIYHPGLMRLLRDGRLPYVLLVQFNSEFLRIAPAERSLLRELYRGARATCFVSEYNLRLARRQLTLPLENATVVFNPIRFQLDAPLPWLSQESAPFPRLVSVARFETTWKAQDVLLEALSSTPWNVNWDLRLYGEGPDRTYIEELIQFFNLGSRVALPGYVRQIETAWESAHLGVLPSRGEGMPLAVLECMMCGRPVVTTNVGGIDELISDGVNGFIVEGMDPLSFREGLRRAWSQRSSWPEMGEIAHQRAREVAASKPPAKLLHVLESAILQQK